MWLVRGNVLSWWSDGPWPTFDGFTGTGHSHSEMVLRRSRCNIKQILHWKFTARTNLIVLRDSVWEMSLWCVCTSLLNHPGTVWTKFCVSTFANACWFFSCQSPELVPNNFSQSWKDFRMGKGNWGFQLKIAHSTADKRAARRTSW